MANVCGRKITVNEPTQGTPPASVPLDELFGEGMSNTDETWDEVSRETVTREVGGVTIEDTTSITFTKRGGAGRITLNFSS